MGRRAGLGVEGDMLVAAGPVQVWELVTDIRLPARFSPELQEAAWLDGADRPALGARFQGRNRNQALGDWRTVCHVVELDAPHVFAWAVTDPDGRFGDGPPDPERPIATWRFRLEPEDGGTRLRLGARIGPARSGLSLAIGRWPDKEEKIIERRLADLRAGIEATLGGVKALAEQPTAGPAAPSEPAAPGQPE